jgi:hypothetical protein
MPSSVRAQTVAMSAMLPLVIHILVPVRIQSPSSRTARVRIPAGSDPKSDSVSPIKTCKVILAGPVTTVPEELQDRDYVRHELRPR